MIGSLIPPAKGGGTKRTVDVRTAVNGVMYILSTGCQWAALPKDLLMGALFGLLEIELDGGFWRCAADERIAFGWRVQRLWRVGEFAFDQATLAVVADPRSAGPTHGNGAGFRQFEQAAEAGVPWHSKAASQERHHGAAARRTVRTMR